MQFNGETNNLDLYNDALYWSGANSGNYTIAEFTRNANFALDRVTSLILRADATWKWEDDNLSAGLIDVSTSLVSGTQKYSITTTWLKIRRVRIKDSNGNWVTLKKVEREDISDSELNDSGTPSKYFLLGGFLYLVATPNYASAGGLEIQFQRGADYFATTDTTKEPGFASPFHRLISLHGALDYVDANSIPRRGKVIRDRIGNPPDTDQGIKGRGLEGELVKFYASRDDDQQPHIELEKEDYGADALGGTTDNTPRGFEF